MAISQQETAFRSWVFKVCKRNTNFTPKKGAFSQNVVNNFLAKKLLIYQK